MDRDAARLNLGGMLRRYREAAGMTQAAAAGRLDWSKSKLLRNEGGQSGVSVSDAMAMLALYEITDPAEIAHAREMAKASRSSAWWHRYEALVSAELGRYLQHEAAAASFRVYHPYLIPDLLQTEQYARALLSATGGLYELEDRVRFRMDRNWRRLSNPGVTFEFAVNEEALCRPVGGPRVMQSQLAALLAADSETGLRVIPLSVGIPGPAAPFTLLCSSVTGEAAVFLDDPGGCRLGDSGNAARFAEFFEAVSSQALAGPPLAELIGTYADRFRQAAG